MLIILQLEKMDVDKVTAGLVFLDIMLVILLFTLNLHVYIHTFGDCV